jgi:hypothetical protein
MTDAKCIGLFFALFQNNIKSGWALIRRKGGRWFYLLSRG